jgi:hypothetical protein
MKSLSTLHSYFLSLGYNDTLVGHSPFNIFFIFSIIGFPFLCIFYFFLHIVKDTYIWNRIIENEYVGNIVYPLHIYSRAFKIGPNTF